MCEKGRERRFADSSLSGEDQDLVSYLGESFGDDWDVGVGAFGRGGADLLVWATGTGIALSSLLGFRAWTVFCVGLVCGLCQ